MLIKYSDKSHSNHSCVQKILENKVNPHRLLSSIYQENSVEMGVKLW